MATAAIPHPTASLLGQRVEPFQAPETSLAQHNVHTTLNYYNDPGDGSSPSAAIVGKPETYQRPTVPVEVVVTDISGQTDKYTLDSHGFQLYPHKSKLEVADFDDDDKIKAEYYPETEQLLIDATGASRIFIFDHTIRRQPKDQRPAANAGSNDQKPAVTLRGPVYSVHIDQSYKAALSRVAHHLPDEADKLLQNRYQIINVWRPIKTIYKDPLAVADAHSVPETDLIGAALVYPDRAGETFVVRPNPSRHRWYFKYAQRPDEVTLIKCFDTVEREGVARRVPHSAFIDPAEADKEARESIEVRALVFY